MTSLQTKDLIDEQSALALAYQRLLKICSDPDEAHRLLQLGYRSAHQIANRPEREFIREYLNKNLNHQASAARQVHRKATLIKTNVMLQWNYLRDLYAPHFKQIHRKRNSLIDTLQSTSIPAVKQTAVGDEDPTAENAVQIPDYEDLFPGTFYCDDLGLSMYSPSAYMVDIMQVIEEDITKENDIRPGLTLQDRRPDLWEIPLNVENTQTPIRYIDLIVEVLESQLLENDDYSLLETQKYPFNMPFNYNDAVSSLYLDKLDTSLANIKEAMLRASGTNISWELATLELSSQLQALVDTITNNAADIASYYGLSSEQGFKDASIGTAGDGTIENPYSFKVDDFSLWTGLSSIQVQQLVGQGLSPSEMRDKVNKNFYINQGDEQLNPAVLHKIYLPLEKVALQLTTKGSYVQWPSPYQGMPAFPELTLGLWVKVDELTSNKTIVFYMGDTNNDKGGLGLVVNEKNQAYFGILEDNIDFDADGFDFTNYKGTWVFFTSTLKNANDVNYPNKRVIESYLNGDLTKTLTQIPVAPNSQGVIRVGRGKHVQITQFTGYIGFTSTLRLWDTILSVGDIKRSMYDLNTVEPHLTHRWGMTEGSGTVVNDSVKVDSKINGELKGKTLPIWVTDGLLNITNTRLDRISRFVRLAKHLAISFEDLDTLLYNPYV